MRETPHFWGSRASPPLYSVILRYHPFKPPLFRRDRGRLWTEGQTNTGRWSERGRSRLQGRQIQAGRVIAGGMLTNNCRRVPCAPSVFPRASSPLYSVILRYHPFKPPLFCRDRGRSRLQGRQRQASETIAGGVLEGRQLQAGRVIAGGVDKQPLRCFLRPGGFSLAPASVPLRTHP